MTKSEHTVRSAPQQASSGGVIRIAKPLAFALLLILALGGAYCGAGDSSSPPPVPITSTDVAPVVRRHPDGPLVILGASYAAGWRPALEGITVLNRGMEGQQSWELLARFERDVVQASPRAVVIWGFINDVFRAPREQIRDAETRARDSMARMVALARGHGIEPIVATEVTIRPEDSWSETAAAFVGRVLGRRSYQDYINEHVRATNEWLREFARRERVLLLDLQPVLSGSDGIRRAAYAAEDGSHISAEGYRALTAYAAPILARHLR